MCKAEMELFQLHSDLNLSSDVLLTRSEHLVISGTQNGKLPCGVLKSLSIVAMYMAGSRVFGTAGKNSDYVCTFLKKN